jgi:pimeloyl-ACP methyl ester carboxylesterase
MFDMSPLECQSFSRAGAPCLRYCTTGRGSVSCLLVHGFGEGRYSWDGFVPSLARFCRAIAVDLRGHGDSDWATDGTYDADTHADDLTAFLNATMRSDRVIVMGHSLGGGIGIRLANRIPNTIIALVLIDYSPEPGKHGVARVIADFNSNNRTFPTKEEYVRAMCLQRPLTSIDVVQRHANAALKMTEAGFILKRDPAMAVSPQIDVASAANWSLLANIRCPVLIVRGVGSAILSRETACGMIKRLPDAELRTVSGAGHSIMTDNVSGFANATLPFIDRFAMGDLLSENWTVRS